MSEILAEELLEGSWLVSGLREDRHGTRGSNRKKGQAGEEGNIQIQVGAQPLGLGAHPSVLEQCAVIRVEDATVLTRPVELDASRGSTRR